MSALIRTLLICFMALTLPLQGVASALSQVCAMPGPSSPHMAAQAQTPTVPTQVHSAHGASVDQVDHSAHAHHADHAVADTEATDTHTPCSTGAHCSLCSAMPPQWGHAPLPALDTPAVHLSLRASPPSNFAPEGLERPPRRILA